MARVVALVPDLLFGSRVQGSLTAAGHDVVLVGDTRAARAAIGGGRGPAPGGAAAGADVVVVDLTVTDFDGIAALRELREDSDGSGGLGGARTLAFYSHVDAETRERALRAGFDAVVPRSRMAREGDRVVADLLSSR